MNTVGPGAVGYIVIYAHREGIGLLEHHTDPLSEDIDVDIGIYVLTVKKDLAGYFAALHKIVHPVYRFKEGRLAAARRADKGRYLFLRYGYIYTFKSLEAAIIKMQILCLYLIHKLLTLSKPFGYE